MKSGIYELDEKTLRRINKTKINLLKTTRIKQNSGSVNQGTHN